METNVNTDTKALFVKMALSAWDVQNDRMNKLLDKLSDEQIAKEIAPGKNTGVYLLGHLVAINDNLLPLFDMGEKLYPSLEKLFVSSPDKSGQQFPSITELKKYWTTVNTKLSSQFAKMQPDEWFEKHTSVSAADFAKEPHRNKLNVLISRTNHQSYHLGQLILLQQK
jgi:uncharacterized damage-inducible protein DinB